MMDSQHGEPGMTSEFELHFIQGIGKMTMDAVELLSGKYRGWFRLKRLNGNGTDKIEEKNVVLNFSKKPESGDYSIKGEGSNRFGGFVLQGNLGKDNSVIMYRQYVVKVGSTPKSGITPKAAAPPKPGAAVKKPVGFASSNGGGGAGGRPKASKAEITNNPRTQRLSQHLLRCGELLKEMKKLPGSLFFLEPVDYVKLNIPDYPTLIPTPMDFRTIATKLAAGEYAGPTNFAEDVRLVFKNAITYNAASDNPVHITAREMSVKFEEKFQALNQSLSSKQSVSAAELAAFTSRSNRPPAPTKTKSKGGGASRKSGGAAGGFVVPPDGSMIQMQEMQRKMMDMQNELLTLRSQVGTDVLDKAQPQLSYQEKKTLIDSINELPEQYMERIVAIVQEAKPVGSVEDEEVEVPLDELDTSTLRRLQAVVEEVQFEIDPHGRKRGADSSSTRSQRQPPAKKARSESSAFGTAPAPATAFPEVPVVSSYPVKEEPVVSGAPAIEAPSEDYGDVFAGQAVKVEAVVASADAWASGGGAALASSSSSAAGATEANSSWNQAGSELQARQEREQQRREEEVRLQQQREREDHQRAETLRAEAERQQQQRLEEEKKVVEAAARQEAEMRALREDERRRREQTGAVAVDSADVLKQMESDDL